MGWEHLASALWYATVFGLAFAPACVIGGWWAEDEAVAAIGVSFLLTAMFGYIIVAPLAGIEVGA